MGAWAASLTSNAFTSSTFSATLAVLVSNLSSFLTNFSTFSSALAALSEVVVSASAEASLTLSFSFLISAMAAAPSGVWESCSEMPLTTMSLVPDFLSAEIVLTGSVTTTGVKKGQIKGKVWVR